MNFDRRNDRKSFGGIEDFLGQKSEVYCGFVDLQVTTKMADETYEEAIAGLKKLLR